MESIIKARWTNSGELIHGLDTNATLVNAIKRDDLLLFKRYFQNINGESLFLVEKKLYEVCYRPQQELEHACEIQLAQDTKYLSLKDFRSMGKLAYLTTNAMDYCQSINQRKQLMFQKNYEDLHKDNKNYIELKEVWFTSSIELELLVDENNLSICTWDVVQKYRSIILPIFDSGNNNWMCVLIDLSTNTISYYDPITNLFSNVVFRNKFKSSIIRRYSLLNNWDIQPLRSSMIELTFENMNNYDSGMIVIATILFIIQHCPIFFNVVDVNVFRVNFCFDLLSSVLNK
jgi:hypothetical protein